MYVNSSSQTDFDLELYSPTGTLKAGSHWPAGYSDSIGPNIDYSGNWTIRIYRAGAGEGLCSFSVLVGWPSGGCPYLYVYNGTEYVSEGLLNIHNHENLDMKMNHTLCTAPQRVGWTYTLRLTEHPKTRSHIDQVKLYAVLKDKTVVNLPLIYAWHSENGFVLPQLLFSDNWRTTTLGADHNNGTSQSINLKFLALPPNIEVLNFMFQIEGYNADEKE